jgi:6-pyruvoyltetrahydropterin/6-carboxytetrahydropterin synthase
MMIYRVAKKIHFSAAHRLKGLEEGHPCKKLHGHNWEVEVVLQGGKPANQAILVDFRELAAAMGIITTRYDHGDLNQFFDNPTCEEVALAILLEVRTQFPDLHVRVRVSEGPTSWAEVEDR